LEKILVTCCPSWDSVVQLEPTLEAVYHQYGPCTLTLATLEEFIPFFEHHPLVSEVIAYRGQNDPRLQGYEFYIDIPDPDECGSRLPTVDVFADESHVTLFRRTPKIFLPEWPEDKDVVIQAKGAHIVDEYEFGLPGYSQKAPVLDLDQPRNNEELRTQLSLMASSLLVVGPDGWMTQAAAALDARVIIGIDAKSEKRRAPFNVTITGPESDSIGRSVADVLYEKRYPEFLNCGNAAEFIKNTAKQYMTANFVDVGCSAWPIPNGVPVDTRNREVIENAPEGFYSGVFSSHCLEHIAEWEKELALWHRVMRKDGHMFLYLPHPRAEVWQAFTGSWVKDNHVWNPEPVTLVQHLIEKLGMEIIEYTSRRDPLWSFYIVARKR
jgi:hypothetical protein